MHAFAFLVISMVASSLDEAQPKAKPKPPPDPKYMGVPASVWAEGLADRDSATREASIRALRSCGAESLPYLKKAFEDEDETGRHAVRMVCIGLGKDCLPFFAGYFDHKDESLKIRAAWNAVWVHGFQTILAPKSKERARVIEILGEAKAADKLDATGLAQLEKITKDH